MQQEVGSSEAPVVGFEAILNIVAKHFCQHVLKIRTAVNVLAKTIVSLLAKTVVSLLAKTKACHEVTGCRQHHQLND